jgi:hypothetical protein
VDRDSSVVALTVIGAIVRLIANFLHTIAMFRLYHEVAKAPPIATKAIAVVLGALIATSFGLLLGAISSPAEAAALSNAYASLYTAMVCVDVLLIGVMFAVGFGGRSRIWWLAMCAHVCYAIICGLIVLRDTIWLDMELLVMPLRMTTSLQFAIYTTAHYNQVMQLSRFVSASAVGGLGSGFVGGVVDGDTLSTCSTEVPQDDPV